MSATLMFDLRAPEPSLTAVITNAVLEGGDPFPLTVRNSLGLPLEDGAYRFTGDYLRDLIPSGTQYLFDWSFSTSTNGDVVWNGTTAWAGGHAWYVAITNVALVPAASLSVARVGTGSVEMAWGTNFADYVLEYAGGLAASGWSPVTNVATSAGDRLAVTLEAGGSNRFYRLRRP
jgi:hypothetical protein